MLTDKELELLDRIKKKKLYEDKFFEKQSNPKWFSELQKRGYFNPNIDTNPQESKEKGYFTIPQWNVLLYLEKVSQQVNEPDNEKYIYELLTIIKEVSNYKDTNGQHIDNYRTWWYFVKILINIPNDKFSMGIIDLIPIWLDSKFNNMLPASEIAKKLLPKFLDSNKLEDLQKAERIIDIATQIKWVPKYTEQQKKEIKEKDKHIFEKPKEERTDEEKFEIAFLRLDEEEPKTIIDAHWLIESFINQKISTKVGEKCSENVIFNLAEKLKSIFEKEQPSGKVDLSYIWFRSLFATPHIYDTEQVITSVLRDILVAKSRKNKDVTLKIIEKFLSEYQYPLFKRIVLFVIRTEWISYKDVFWKMVNEDKEAHLFNDSHYEPEVYTVLQRHVSAFSSGKKEQIRDIIENKVPGKPHPEEKYKEYYSAYQKQKWYSAVKSDEYFKPLYEKHKSITMKEEEVSFKEPEVRVGPGPSPLSKEAILKMSNEALAKYSKEFKTVDFWKGPTIGGLSDILKDIVQEKPEKFVDNLNPFLKTGYLYVCDILRSIRDSWEKRKIIDWGKLFKFIKEYITPKDFWKDKYKVEGDDRNANHLWVIGMIGELIQEGTKDDAWSFSEEHFQIAQEIVFLMLNEMLKEKEKIIVKQPIQDDMIFYALNSTFGKITEALFMLALRIRRFEEKSRTKQIVSWEVNIKKKYDELLKNEIIESYVWLGIYLQDFYYLDKRWAENQIKTISIEKIQLWEAFMDGYLSGSRVYNELYILMRPHYEKAIDYQFKEKYSPDRLVQHICVEYLRDIEDIRDINSLFRKLLDKWDISQIKEIIGFFWIQRDYLIEKINDQSKIEITSEDEKIKQKIIDFWRWVYENKYKGKREDELNNDDKKILSELCNLTVFLPEINPENFEWLKISALFADVSFHSSFFIEYLNELKDKKQSVDFVGKVYLEMLKNATLLFSEENIHSIVEFLYQKGKKEEADTICNIYVGQGEEFLGKLHGQYNKKQ